MQVCRRRSSETQVVVYCWKTMSAQSVCRSMQRHSREYVAVIRKDFKECFGNKPGCCQMGDGPLQQSSIDTPEDFAGREGLFLWDNGGGEFLSYVQERLGENGTSAWVRGGQAWGRVGIVVKIMGELPVTRYTGEIYDNNVAVIVPRRNSDLPAVWAYCSSAVFRKEVRRLNNKLSVTDESFVMVPFELPRWQKIAAGQYPNGLPEPYSNKSDPVDISRPSVRQCCLGRRGQVHIRGATPSRCNRSSGHGCAVARVPLAC